MTEDDDAEGASESRVEISPEEAFQMVPDPDREGVEPYEVFVQWERGEPHEHAETIDAPSDAMAAMLAKRNIDVRSEPLSIWVTPRRTLTRTPGTDPSLVPTTDRSYRSVQWYAEHQLELEGEQSGADDA
jgi:1,2-phenylacetyl-CoA epoxidase PaaB subunit